MDPAWAAPLAVIAGGVTTAITYWAAYRWPRGYHRGPGGRAVRNEEDHDEPAT